MKKAVLTGLLAVASVISISQFAAAQAADIILPPAEANAYNAALGQTTPAAKAEALESFLTQYPNTKVKTYALEQLVQAYGQSDAAKVVPTADRLLQADPNNLRGLAMEVYFRKAGADAMTDQTQKQAALDQAASFAEKGIAAFANKPAGMSDADYNQLKMIAIPTFYSTIGQDDLLKNDAAGAVAAYTKEMAAVPEAQTQTPGTVLADEFYMGQAYLQEKPQDLVHCAYYTARAANFAPDPLKAQMLKTAEYCYTKYHGKPDGFDAVQATAAKSLTPPADFKIDPAPSPAELAHQALQGTDPSSLAIGDREFILANGSMKDATGVTDSDKVWTTLQGKTYKIDGVVIGSTPATDGGIPTQLKLAVSEDAQQTKTADVALNLTPLTAPEEPKSKAPAAVAHYKHEMAAYQKQVDAINAAVAPGSKITFNGTYDSYTTTPSIMITMKDGQVVLPEAAKPAARPAAHRRPRQ